MLPQRLTVHIIGPFFLRRSFGLDATHLGRNRGVIVDDGHARSPALAGFQALQFFRVTDGEIVLVRLQALHQPPAARTNTVAEPPNVGLAVSELLCLRRCWRPQYRD